MHILLKSNLFAKSTKMRKTGPVAEPLDPFDLQKRCARATLAHLGALGAHFSNISLILANFALFA